LQKGLTALKSAPNSIFEKFKLNGFAISRKKAYHNIGVIVKIPSSKEIPTIGINIHNVPIFKGSLHFQQLVPKNTVIPRQNTFLGTPF